MADILNYDKIKGLIYTEKSNFGHSIGKYTFNIDWIEIYREEKEKYNIPTVSLPKNLGTFFLNYCLKEMMNKHNEMDIKFSTLDNCIDNKGDIYFYKKLGYEWIYFDEKENKPSGPEMIKFL